MISRRIAILLALVAFGLGAGAGTVGLLWATGGVAAPSRDVREIAPTLALDAPTPTPGIEARIADELAQINARLDALATQIAAPAPADSAAPAADAPAEAAAALPRRALYRITEDGSEARFKINEVLLGNPTLVVGTTRRVAGDVIVDFASPAQSQVGVIAINVRTLRTDQEFRDQAIRGQILQSSRDEYEFVTFQPAAYAGLPDGPVNVGDALDFQITGALTIRGVTRDVTFDTRVTVEADDRISGTASATILYSDFGIGINAPPTVSDIGDEVTLEIDFVALQASE
jgi:polyisoprenoid-binding protein YceI